MTDPLKLKLVRAPRVPEYCEGEMFYMNKNERLCDTLEDPIRDVDGSGNFDGEEKKVYGDTAIPYGKYDIEVTWSPKFQMGMVLVKGVDQFTGVRFHYGRTKKNTHGCILVGKKSGDGILRDIDMTEKLVQLLLDHGNKGTLEII